MQNNSYLLLKAIIYTVFLLLSCTSMTFGMPANASNLENRFQSTVLTLDEVITIAITNNQDLKAATYTLKQAEGRLKQSGLWSNPELEFAFNTDKTFNNEGEYATSSGFKQKFPISGRLSQSKEVARVDVAMALAEVANQKRLLIAEVSGKVRELYLLDQQIRINEKLRDTAAGLLNALEKRKKVAEVSETDYNLEKLELQKHIFTSANIISEREATRAKLNVLLGRDPLFALSIASPPYSQEFINNLVEIVKDAEFRRPDRQLVALSVDRAAAELKLAKAERWEDWTIGFGYDKDRSVFNDPIGNKNDQFIGVNISIPLPLWNQNEGRISEVAASKGKAQAELTAIELKIQEEILSSQIKVQQLNSLLNQYNNSSLTLAEKNLGLLKQSYDQGLIDITTLIQGQQQLSEIQTAFLDAQNNFLKALTEFEAATASSTFLKSTEVK